MKSDSLTGNLRIGLLDWDSKVREGRELLLSSANQISVVLSSSGSRADLEIIRDSLLDVLIIAHQLDSYSGIDFYKELLSLENNSPPAILNVPFVTKDITFEALSAGFSFLVEVGDSNFIKSILDVGTGQIHYSLDELKTLLVGKETEVDIELEDLVRSLSKKARKNLVELRSGWRADNSPEFSLLSLTHLTKELGCVTSMQAVAKLYLAGMLDGRE
jgi:DNA-binding NarL/FixJ family response regulator